MTKNVADITDNVRKSEKQAKLPKSPSSGQIFLLQELQLVIRNLIWL